MHRAHLLAINAHEPNAQLQVQVDRLTWRLCAAGLVGVLVVAALGWWREYDFHALLVGSVILAFATIPQGLPVLAQAVLGSASLSLAADSNILVKKMATAAELGSVTAVVTDKTATLTEDRLTLDVVGMYDRLTERQRLAPLVGNEVAYLRSLMHCWTLSAPPLSLPAAHVFQVCARISGAHVRFHSRHQQPIIGATWPDASYSQNQ